ncbi:transmembrane 4 L6 family member 5 [Myripristis murdjan]|uniref:Transmembrane 4 L six family member 21b n=1 Tax=Myripristis murdjan TaxID=586833 RepID=A0A667ZJG8_9TELE|nr:transmembrane 4 L6 family member 5-like [Myripristis murdjan]
MCTGKCSKFIAISLYVLAAVSVICNIILFFPDFETKYAAADRDGKPRITEEVKYMGGLVGGGIMVLVPAIHIHLTSAKGCCANRCGMFLSIGFAAAGVVGALYSLSTAALGLANGPTCYWRNWQNPLPDWGTPFRNSNGSYLSDRDMWKWCKEPENVVEFNVALFSTLLVAASVELILCLIQMVNGLFGCLCGTCAGKEVRPQLLNATFRISRLE